MGGGDARTTMVVGRAGIVFNSSFVCVYLKLFETVTGGKDGPLGTHRLREKIPGKENESCFSIPLVVIIKNIRPRALVCCTDTHLLYDIHEPILFYHIASTSSKISSAGGIQGTLPEIRSKL